MPQYMMFGFAVLCFNMKYKGNLVQDGIDRYNRGLHHDLQDYGLKMNGRLLYLTNAAATSIFGGGVRSYADSKLWHRNGPIYNKAKLATRYQVNQAISHFEKSLSERRRSGDAAHDHMRRNIQACVDELKKLI